jgi:hypothetical protein
MSYADRITPSLTVGIPNDYKFNLNSVYDPDLTSAGHQPYGFDQMAAFYTRYVVRAVQFQLHCIANAGNFVTFTTVPNDSLTSLTSESLAAESPLSMTVVSASASPSEAQILSGKVDLWKLTGQPLDQYLSGAQYWGTIAASPSENLVLHCVTQGDATSASGVSFFIKLVFDVEWFDPIQLPQS